MTILYINNITCDNNIKIYELQNMTKYEITIRINELVQSLDLPEELSALVYKAMRKPDGFTKDKLIELLQKCEEHV